MANAMRTVRYRTVVWIEKKSNKQVGVEIYDHENDPQEMQNLAGSDAALDQKLVAATREQHGLTSRNFLQVPLHRDAGRPSQLYFFAPSSLA